MYAGAEHGAPVQGLGLVASLGLFHADRSSHQFATSSVIAFTSGCCKVPVTANECADDPPFISISRSNEIVPDNGNRILTPSQQAMRDLDVAVRDGGVGAPLIEMDKGLSVDRQRIFRSRILLCSSPNGRRPWPNVPDPVRETRTSAAGPRDWPGRCPIARRRYWPTRWARRWSPARPADTRVVARCVDRTSQMHCPVRNRAVQRSDLDRISADVNRTDLHHAPPASRSKSRRSEQYRRGPATGRNGGRCDRESAAETHRLRRFPATWIGAPPGPAPATTSEKCPTHGVLASTASRDIPGFPVPPASRN